MNLNFSVSSTIVHEKSKIFGEATSHMLVRSSCFSACRSIASAIKRSTSCAYGRPLASHIFEYMLIVVKPGMVFTSFKYSTWLSPASRKSTRAMPAPSIALNAATAFERTSSACASVSGAGIRSFDPSTRNLFDLTAIPLVQKLSHLPIVADPSHGTGLRDKVIPMARAAIAAGADGVMIEVHPEPDRALSDGAQSLYPDQFTQLVGELRAVAAAIGRSVPPPKSGTA